MKLDECNPSPLPMSQPIPTTLEDTILCPWIRPIRIPSQPPNQCPQQSLRQYCPTIVPFLNFSSLTAAASPPPGFRRRRLQNHALLADGPELRNASHSGGLGDRPARTGSSRSWPQHPTRGYMPPRNLRAGTLAINQPGAGTKWYPEYRDAGAKRRDLQRLNENPIPK